MSAAPEDERPPFARAWPRDEELEALLAAFSRGNHALVRDRAPELAKRTGDPRVRDAALDLRRRIDPDPLSALLLLVAIGLLVVLASHYLGHRPDDATPSKPRPVTKQPGSP